MPVATLLAHTIQMVSRPTGGFASYNWGSVSINETGRDSVSSSATVSAATNLATANLVETGRDAIVSNVITGPAQWWQRPLPMAQRRSQDMFWICPRDDSATGVTAADTVVKTFHSVAYPGVPYERPAGVAFGSYPHEIDVVSGPDGLVMELRDVKTPTGVFVKRWMIVWPNPTTGSHVVTLRARDQEYQRGTNPSSAVTVTYTINCKTSLWVVVQTGTLVATIADVHKATEGDATYNGRAILFRAGTYMVTAPGGGPELSLNSKPKFWTYYPGESVTLDFSQAQISIGNGSSFWIDIDQAVGSCQALPNSHCIFAESYVQNNSGVTCKRAAGGRRGSSPDSNPGFLTLFAPSNVRQYFYFSCEEITDYAMPAIDSYGISGLIEFIFAHHNVYTSGGEGQVIFPKGGNVNLCIRNVFTRNITGANHILLLGSPNPVPQRNIEVSWCDLWSDSIAIMTNNAGAEGAISDVRNIWIVRNTIRGTIQQGWEEGFAQASFYNQIYIVDNIIVTSSPQVMPTLGRRTVIPSGNLTGTAAMGILDSNNLLSPAYQANLGYVGREAA
jgi:hypothetical protein